MIWRGEEVLTKQLYSLNLIYEIRNCLISELARFLNVSDQLLKFRGHGSECMIFCAFSFRDVVVCH